MEGHNPSGHCLVASKIIDYVPLSVSSSENLHPPKKQALDQTVQSTDSSCPTPELSLVGKLFYIIEMELTMIYLVQKDCAAKNIFFP